MKPLSHHSDHRHGKVTHEITVVIIMVRLKLVWPDVCFHDINMGTADALMSKKLTEGPCSKVCYYY